MTAILLSLLLSLQTPQTSTATTPVELNSATAAELRSLPGIGEKRAAAIIRRRNRRPFRRVRELLYIRGIGRKTLKKLRPRVRVALSKGKPRRRRRQKRSQRSNPRLSGR